MKLCSSSQGMCQLLGAARQQMLYTCMAALSLQVGYQTINVPCLGLQLLITGGNEVMSL